MTKFPEDLYDYDYQDTRKYIAQKLQKTYDLIKEAQTLANSYKIEMDLYHELDQIDATIEDLGGV